MDLVFVTLTVIFFALSWALLKLCERLSIARHAFSAHDNK